MQYPLLMLGRVGTPRVLVPAHLFPLFSDRLCSLFLSLTAAPLRLTPRSISYLLFSDTVWNHRFLHHTGEHSCRSNGIARLGVPDPRPVTSRLPSSLNLLDYFSQALHLRLQKLPFLTSAPTKPSPRKWSRQTPGLSKGVSIAPISGTIQPSTFAVSNEFPLLSEYHAVSQLSPFNTLPLLTYCIASWPLTALRRYFCVYACAPMCVYVKAGEIHRILLHKPILVRKEIALE